MTINIAPIQLWSDTGLKTANTIEFGEWNYNPTTGELSAAYYISGQAEPMARGTVGVPKSIVDTWESDTTITDYVIQQLGLTKV